MIEQDKELHIAAALLTNKAAMTIVSVQMISVAIVALVVLLTFFMDSNNFWILW